MTDEEKARLLAVAPKHMRYVGPLHSLRCENALVRNSDGPCDADGDFEVLAQFDGWGAVRDGVDLAHGWHKFRRKDFVEIE